MTTNSTLPTYFISHGGGPWPWMKDELNGMYDRLEASLADMPRQIGRKPRAVLMVSAHWEAPSFTVMTTEHPPMIYDYGGFPEHTYRIRYASRGAPAVAERVAELVAGAGIRIDADHERGYDHGMFSPMQAIYPAADVPVLQLSLKSGLDPREHLALGRALVPLRDEDILIVGSGLSYHNLRAFGPAAKTASAAFDAWLQQTVVASAPAERTERLIGWDRAPAARQAHPREEHLLPLMVAVGAAEDEAAALVYHETAFVGGVTASSFRFGAAAG